MFNEGFLGLLEHRRSCRHFAPKELDEETINKLLLAANGAPVGSNRAEDIHITVVNDHAVIDDLSLAMKRRREDTETMAFITEKVRGGDSFQSRKFDPFYGAPLVFFVSHRRQTVQPGIEFANVMSVAMAMHLEATELGLGSVFIWGALEAMRMYPEYDRTSELLLPQGFEPLLGLSVGYPAEPTEPKRLRRDRFTVNVLERNEE